ncbi:hypothetical protein EV361DRAFT_940339 [Lentinula raphanica]|uniref:Uncharacterized protein n=1 Tax=Lentinula raphanica TaxID=153919 RepID=A0AA38P5T4_9AGAR|nr:hypothetical protein F5878DRAFT_624787 [Lentinula raphanica]KAJ3965108.1 hypothetical protein EV361DRAFT_940339 [Lentinula raphanica]
MTSTMGTRIKNKEDKRIIDCSDQELIDAGFMGPDVPPSVKLTIDTVRAHPDLLDGLTLFTLECQYLCAHQSSESTLDDDHWDTPTLSSQRSTLASDTDDSTLTTAPVHLVSEFERTHYYHGISPDPPALLYRSDLESNPFPVPSPGTKWFSLPVKTAQGVFDTPLTPVWHTVAPEIIALLKERRIRWSALNTARFSVSHDEEDGSETLGPIVIWIATHPGTTSAQAARDASPHILRILESHSVHGAVVEWYEGRMINH